MYPMKGEYGMKKMPKKLVLKKETVKALQEGSLNAIVGAYPLSMFSDCWKCSVAPACVL